MCGAYCFPRNLWVRTRYVRRLWGRKDASSRVTGMSTSVIRLRSPERRRESLFPLRIPAAGGTEWYATEGGLRGPRAWLRNILFSAQAITTKGHFRFSPRNTSSTKIHFLSGENVLPKKKRKSFRLKGENERGQANIELKHESSLLSL